MQHPVHVADRARVQPAGAVATPVDQQPRVERLQLQRLKRLQRAAAKLRQDMRLEQLAVAMDGGRLAYSRHVRQPALGVLGEREPLRLEDDALVPARQLGPPRDFGGLAGREAA
jgi:hypothetical protein